MISDHFKASKGAVSADNTCSERYSGVFRTSKTAWLFCSILSIASAAEMENVNVSNLLFQNDKDDFIVCYPGIFQ